MKEDNKENLITILYTTHTIEDNKAASYMLFVLEKRMCREDTSFFCCILVNHTTLLSCTLQYND